MTWSGKSSSASHGQHADTARWDTLHSLLLRLWFLQFMTVDWNVARLVLSFGSGRFQVSLALLILAFNQCSECVLWSIVVAGVGGSDRYSGASDMTALAKGLTRSPCDPRCKRQCRCWGRSRRRSGAVALRCRRLVGIRASSMFGNNDRRIVENERLGTQQQFANILHQSALYAQRRRPTDAVSSSARAW